MNIELKQKLELIEKQKADLANQENEIRQAVLADIRELIQRFHFSASELRLNTHRKKEPAAMFKSPYDDQVWSGRGRKPAWYSQALAEGYSDEDMRISN